VERPRVVVFGEASLDGRITLAPDVLLLFGDARWPACGETNAQERLIRLHAPQALLEGSGSFVLEGAEPEPLPPAKSAGTARRDFVPGDIAARDGFRGWFVVVDGRGRVRWSYTGEPGREAPGSEGWHLLVLVSDGTPSEYLAYLEREHVPYLVAGSGPVDLRLALEKLAQLGVKTLLATSPGKLGNALLRAGCVDEIDLDVLPAVIGGAGTPTLFAGPELGPDEHPTRLRLLSAESEAAGRVLLRYEVAAPA
jgi:2,5-diamino-6-(ribosylamino)-4(3H)-pyrimidinone 5'-phosphate reductase